MNRVWDKVKFYRTMPGVRHKKSGWELAKTTSAMRLEHLMDEVIELISAPHDLKEMADVAAILFHHVQAEGYSREEFSDCILKKLEERLDVPTMATGRFSCAQVNQANMMKGAGPVAPG